MSRRNSQRGQAVLESILLMAVVLSCWAVANKALQETDLYARIFNEPWGRLKNIIESGIPTTNSEEAINSHPASADRHSTRFETP